MDIRTLASIMIAVFVLVHAPGGDEVRTYKTQTQAEVTVILDAEGNPYTFITQLDVSRYQAPTVTTIDSAARLAAKKQAHLDVKNGLLTPIQRLQALLILQDLDQ